MKLWKQYNLLRGHISANIDAAMKNNHWLTDEQPLTLAFPAKDDSGHTETHSAHLQTRFNTIAGTIRL